MILILLTLSLAAAEHWTRFRGPNGSGVSRDTGFPAELVKEKAVWRAPVRPGKSSPILTDRHVLLTGFENGKLYTQSFDRTTGKLLWEAAETRPRDEEVNKLNHPAAITPVTDGENVYAFFKDLGFVSYTLDGKPRWKAPQGPFVVSMGLGASPVLAGNSVILVADQMEGSYIAAFDKRNGELRWKIAREEGESWATPVVTGENVITAGRGYLGVHRAADGKRIGTLGGLSPAVVASPVVDGDTVIYFGYGNDEPPPFAQRLSRLDKNGDGKLTPDEYGDDAFTRSIAKYGGNRDMAVTQDEWDERQRTIIGHNGVIAVRVDGAEPKERWRTTKILNGVIPSPLLYQGVIYVVKNGGILAAFDAATGALTKEGRLAGAIAGYSSSPVAADGRVYFANEDGKIAVVRAGREWDVLGVYDLGEPCFATPALSKGQVYVRTSDALYRFESAK
jgi:outer membrane protein assembly factor BamB